MNVKCVQCLVTCSIPDGSAEDQKFICSQCLDRDENMRSMEISKVLKKVAINFSNMNDDALLSWWLFMKVDSQPMPEPPHFCSWILEFKMDRGQVISTLHIEYNS